MPDDALVQSRSTQASLIGNRGTGEFWYVFTLPTTDELRELHQKPSIEFHVAVWTAIFGPNLRTIPLRLAQFSRIEGLLAGETFNYRLTNQTVKEVAKRDGLMPRVKAVTIDADGKKVEDVNGYGHQGALIERLDKPGQKVIADIVRGNIGFDLGDGQFWTSLKFHERAEAMRELTDIVDLLSDLDDAAYVELLQDLPAGDRGYRNPARQHRIDLLKIRNFRSSLEVRKEQTDSRARRVRIAEFDAAMESNSLIGCHELYFKKKELARSQPEYHVDMASVGRTTRMQSEESPRQKQLRAEIQAILRAKGFDSGTLDKLEAAFRESFQRRAAAFARERLLGYQRLFEHHLARTDTEAMMRAIRRQGSASLERIFNRESLGSREAMFNALADSKTEYEALTQRFPLMQYTNFWTIVWKANKAPKGAFSIAHFNVMVDQTREAIVSMLEELKDPSYVWKGDLVIDAALHSFGIYADPSEGQTHNAMLTDIVHRKMRSQKSKGIFTGILLAILAIALSATGVGWLVALGVGLSLYDVYAMIGDQAEIERHNLSGFDSSTPPSDFWILIAVVGAGADVGGLVKLIKTGRAAAALSSAHALDDLLIEAGITSDKARKAAESLRVIKSDLNKATVALKGAVMSMGSMGAASNEVVVVGYHLARLGITDFRHFLLELSSRKILAKIVGIADPDLIIKDPDALKLLRPLHRRGLLKARNELADLDELVVAVSETGQEFNDAERVASKLWDQRSAKGVSRNPKHTQSPYNTLYDAHQAAKSRGEWLRLKLSALKARMRQLRPADSKTAMLWGVDAEDWVRVVVDKKKWPGKRPWPQMHSKTTKSFDSIRRGPRGKPEAMQSKAIVHPTQAELVEKISGKIRNAERNFNKNYKDVARQFNGGTLPVSSNDLKVTLPPDWRDLGMKIYLEVPVITRTPLDVAAARVAVEDLFRSKFPANAVLNIRTVSEEEIVDVLARMGSM